MKKVKYNNNNLVLLPKVLNHKNTVEIHRPVTTVFQSDNLFDHLNCARNVSIGITGTSVS